MADASTLRVRDLTIQYRQGAGRPRLRAVEGVSFDIAPGETVGLIGASGSGKTSVANAVLGLVPFQAGTIEINGTKVTNRGRVRRGAGRPAVQAVFQNPYRAMDPYLPIWKSVAEPLIADGVGNDLRPRQRHRHLMDRAADALSRVGISPDTIFRYPREFSGGQLQRIAIARAMIGTPSLVICDEPTSALDVSIRGQILNLLVEEQERRNLSYLYISHDMNVVRGLCLRSIVLLNGRAVESGATEQIYEAPQSEYTRRLIAATPTLDRLAPGTQLRSRGEVMSADGQLV